MDGFCRLLGRRQDRPVVPGTGCASRNRPAIGLGSMQEARTAQPADLGGPDMQHPPPPDQFDLANMVANLNSLLRLKTAVIGMKIFASAHEMAAIPKIRRPSA